MGPERYGRVRGYGVGVTPTQLSAVSRFTQDSRDDTRDACVRELKAEIEEVRQGRAADRAEMQAQMQAMREHIDRLTSALQMYAPSQVILYIT